MPCYSPIHGWAARRRHPSGKTRFTTNRSEAAGKAIIVPCGKCIGCRLDKSRDHAIRCVHEAQMHKDNCFITLTYKTVPADKSLHHEHWQAFMKRLRQRYAPKIIRFYMCGEYGEQRSRPHYHALLFNHAFTDLEPCGTNNHQLVYTSKTLEFLWRRGFVTVGTVTFESAAYCARYVMKKVGGDLALEHYATSDDHGEYFPNLKPEYNRMSLKPGLGASWFKQYKSDVYPHGYVVMPNKAKCQPPKYYQTLLEREDPAAFAALKKQTQAHHMSQPELTPAQLKTNEQAKLLQIRKLKRTIHQ